MSCKTWKEWEKRFCIRFSKYKNLKTGVLKISEVTSHFCSQRIWMWFGLAICIFLQRYPFMGLVC
jgi:hypothetical protein